MKTRLSSRVLSLVLVVALLAGMVVPVHAVGSKSDVTFTQVDNSAVSVNPLKPSVDDELHTMDEYLDTEFVRVSIILNKASTISAGFSTMNIADNVDVILFMMINFYSVSTTTMVQYLRYGTGIDIDNAPFLGVTSEGIPPFTSGEATHTFLTLAAERIEMTTSVTSLGSA